MQFSSYHVQPVSHVGVCLRVTFEGELGVDYGGIKREFFTNAIKEIISHTNVLAPCSNGRLLWFANQPAAQAGEVNNNMRKMPRLDHTSDVTQSDTASGRADGGFQPKRRLAYYLGLIVGMATYNGVHVDVPLPSCVYKTMKGQEVK